ncbi:export s SecD/SecF fusion domain protein, partial [Chlamydia psittaci 84-8471/1]
LEKAMLSVVLFSHQRKVVRIFLRDLSM